MPREVTIPALPRYRCHKVVQAMRIGAITVTHGGSVILHPEEGASLPAAGAIGVSCVYFNKHQPHVGGYYVRYEDGYESFSPADAFEAGYTLIDK